MKFIKNNLIEIFLVALIITLFGAVVAASWIDVKYTKPAGYAAWCKHTGNPNKLTYKEWKALVDSTRNSDTSILIVNTK